MKNSNKTKKKEASKSQSSDNSEPGIEMADAGNMDKIRDILFGNQARDYEKRFTKMENRVAQETAELKQEILKRLDSLEGYVKQELRDIKQRISNDSKDRNDAEKSIYNEMETNFDKLTKKIVIEEENLAKKSSELREQILEQSKVLSEDILTKHDHTANTLRQTAQELDDAKVNRSDLSGFLLEIAMRLSGDDSNSSQGN
ncbi:MAG: hypothetical protein GY699_15185 [Desulfobacteraceae bacterium]|nr:hypothetical protein [Desulfobacteraceae bacterium]